MGEDSFELDPNTQLETANELTAATYLNDLGLNWENLKGKRILDIGAGLAGFAQAARKRGVDVVSLDAHPEWWQGERKPPTDIPFVIGDGRKLPFKDGAFDEIVGRASVHSIVEVKEDLETVISESKRVLKPGGEFRFGPGSINVRPVRENEWEKWFEILEKVRNNEELTAEEDVWGAKVWPEYEKELNDDEVLEGLSREERIKKLQELSLTRLQSIDPTITMNTISRTLDLHGEQETFEDVYYILKKEPVST